MLGKYISTTEAAKILGISRIAVFRKIKSGQIEAKKVGRNFVIDKKQILGQAGKLLTPQRRKLIEQAVKKVVQEYGETLRLLGQE